MAPPVPARRAARLYGLLLRLFPREFREDVGAEMAAAFRDRYSRALEDRGRLGALALWPRAVADVLASAAAEWRSPSRRPSPAHAPAGKTLRPRDIMTDFVHDVRYAMRMLAKNPVFTVAAVLTLGVGIGLNVATFSAVHALLLRPPPGVEEPERLVQLYRSFAGIPYGSNSVPHYRDLRDDLGGDVYESVAAWSFAPLALSADGRSERLMGMMVSANFFQTFGVDPVLGRAFVPGEEDRGAGAHPVAVLGNGFWRDRFGGDPSVVGRTLLVNGQPFEVVGVAPADFNSPLGMTAPPVFVPLMMEPVIQPGSNRLERRGSNFMSVYARLADGVTVAQARQATDAWFASMLERYPDAYASTEGIRLIPQMEAGLHPSIRDAQVGMSAVMMAVVGLLLLIACVNVANLFLARARERRQEMGVRLSLGAGRGRIVRQLLTESLVFSALAGGAGLALALGATRLMSRARPPIEGPWAFEFGLDGPVLLFALAASLAAGVLFGLAPALQASRSDTVAALRSGGRRGSGGSRLVGGLVVAQVALSLLLLVSSGLFLRSLQGATAVDKGFEAEHLLLASVDPGLQGYSREEADVFYRRLLERVRATPGVRSAALGEVVPLGMSNQQNGIRVPGYEFGPDEGNSIDYNVVGDGYFETMGVDVLRGSGFRSSDLERDVMVVNRRFAERFWPGEDPVGQTVSMGGRDWSVIGVAEDGKYRTLGEEPLAYMYLPHGAVWQFGMTLHVRTTGDPAAVAPRVRAEISALDPDLPVYDVKTMENHLGYALAPARLGGQALGLFGVIGLLLAAVGIYGVMAYSVSQRRREMGIRAALGADRSTVVGLVLREGLRLALVGTAIGLVAAVGASRLLEGLLYDVSALDPVAFTVVPALLLGVAALAVWIPARRAAGTDPMRALRIE